MKPKVKPLLIALVVFLGILIFIKIKIKQAPLAGRLASVDDDTRNMALAELSKLDAEERKETVVELLKLPIDPNPRGRRFLVYGLRKLESSTPETIALHARLLADEDAAVREEAMIALLESGETALPTVIDLSRKPNPVVRKGAIHILTKIGEPAITALTTALAAKDADTRTAAALTLYAIHSSSEAVIPVLIEALHKPSWDGQMGEVVMALEKMGPASKLAVPQITALLPNAKESFSDPNAPRPALARALNKIDPRRAELVDLGFDLKQKNPLIRYRAAYLLSESNPPNLGAVSMLVEALNDPDVNVSARAMVALVRIGLDKTERLRKVAYPRMKSVLKRGKAANIEGFAEIVEPALKSIGIN